jgi:hypothetical protein
MFKLDRNSFSSGNIFSKKNESDKYKGRTLKELFEAFRYLNSVAYNYDPTDPPRMDKTIHGFREK